MSTATDVEPVLAGALALLREKPEITLEDLAAQVAAAIPVTPAPVAKPFPALPNEAVLTEEVLAALKGLPKVWGSVVIKDRRSLTAEEITRITAERLIITQIGAALAARDKAIAETIRVHMDVAAEEAGVAVPKDQLAPDHTVIVAATPRDQNGHYLLAGSQKPHQVPAGPVAWSQEYSAAAPAPSDGELQAAYEAGDISRADYLAVTRQVRVFDPVAARAYIRKVPARGLAVLRRITVGGTPKSSLYLRKVS
jgi:hypothetical protein